MGQNKNWQSVILLCLVIFVASCSSGESESPVTASDVPTPTTHPIFGEKGDASSIEENVFDASGSQDEEISPTATPTSPPLPTATPENLVSLSIYDDSMDSNWEIKNSQAMSYELEIDTYTHAGDNAMIIAPTDAYGELYFTVSEDADREFLRDEVVGISFWISGGEEFIGTSDLAVSVVGSNEQPYWVAGDESVENPDGGDPTFSETRLYYLGINRDIPPDTWINVEVWLDELRFDPLYEYVTGFYIKNDELFMQPFYVDDVRIITLGEDE